MLVYPIFKPWNLSGSYKNFVRAGEPIEWPYARTLDGGKIYVQAMVLEGEALAAGIASQTLRLRIARGTKGLRFDAPFAISSKRIAARGHGTTAASASEEAAKRAAA